MRNPELHVVLLARKWTVVSAVLGLVLVTAIVSLLLPKSYTASAAVVVDSKGVDPISGMMSPAQGAPGYIATQVDIISSSNVAKKVVAKLKLDQQSEARAQFVEATNGEGTLQDWLVDAIAKHLDVRPSRDSSVIEINYSARDPRFAAALANAFAEAYIQTNLELKVEPARQTSAWFDDQLRQLRDKLQAAQAKLSEYQQKEGIIAVDERLDIENARLAELSSQLGIAQRDAADSASRQAQLKSAIKAGKTPDSITEIMSNPLIQGLKSEIARAEARFAELSQRLDHNHPEYQRALAEVNSLKSKLQTELHTASSGIANLAELALKRVAEIQAAMTAQKNRVLELKGQRDQLAVLTTEVDSAQRALDSARQRAEQIRLESQAGQTNVAILNVATPPMKPSSPRVLLNIIAALIFGLVFGGLLAIFREHHDRRVRSISDLGDGLGVPILATIGKLA